MDPATTGAQLHTITRGSIVRLPFLVLVALVVAGLTAAFLSAVRTTADALYALALVAMMGAGPALFAGLRWATPQLAAVHEHGVVVRRRGRARFVPWEGVERITRQEIQAQGVPVLQYLVHVAPKPVVVAEALVGTASMNAIVDAIATRAGLAWTPDGAAVREGWVPPPPSPDEVAAAKRDGVAGIALLGVTALLFGAMGVSALVDALDDSRATVTVEQIAAGPAPTARELTVRGVARVETVVSLDTTSDSGDPRRSHYVAVVAPTWAPRRPVHVVFHTRSSPLDQGAGRLRGQSEFRGLRGDALPDQTRVAFTNGGVTLADPLVVLEEDVPERSLLTAGALLAVAAMSLALFALSVWPQRRAPGG